MIKDLENLIKQLNNGKIHGATVSLSKFLKISNVSVHNWLAGKSIPSEENINKIAKRANREPDDVKKIFISNSFSNNQNSFNCTDKENELLRKEIELKNKEIELLKKEMELNKRGR